MQRGSWLLGLMLILPQAKAVDNWNVEGAHAVLRVYGALTESACRLEMDSSYQDIQMGETGTAQLRRMGDRGTAIAFNLRLKDCLRAATSIRDEQTGGLTWSPNQPSLAMTFLSALDENNPQLIKAQGISGMGLRLEQSDGQSVALGHRNKALILAQGKNTLSYKLTPERTSCPLVVGNYTAVVDFRLNYN